MDQTIALYRDIRGASESRIKVLTKKFNITEDSVPIAGLSMSHNYVTCALEQVSWYYDTWRKCTSTSVANIEQLQNENAERVILLGKGTLILSLSGMEFCLKEAAKSYPDVLKLNGNKRQYLSGIMTRSLEKGLMSAEASSRWSAVSQLRNTLVHNNGIADENLSAIFPNGVELKLVEGKMAEGKLTMFPKLTEWAIGSFADWCDSFLNRAMGASSLV